MLLQTAIWSTDNKLVASKHATRRAVVRIWARIAANLVEDWNVKVAALGMVSVRNRRPKPEPTGSARQEEPKPTKLDRFDQMNQMSRTNRFTTLDWYVVHKRTFPRGSQIGHYVF